MPTVAAELLQVGGQVGKYIVESLLKTGKHRVTAITRADSTSKIPDGVEARKVNYDDQDSLVQALQGQEVLIITMGVTAPPEQEYKLFEAAAAANVKWVVPNEWGADGTNEELGKDIMYGPQKAAARKHIEKLGKSSWIGLACGFWYEYSLGSGSDAFGFSFKDRTVTFIDDGTTRINTTTWPQCGCAIAALLSLKVLPDDENDNSPCMAQFRDKYCYISSFLISQKDMFDSVLRVTGTSADDWTVTYEGHKERYDSGMALLQQGNRSGFRRLLYTRLFYPNGDGNYEASRGLDNDLLGLPKEDLDEHTKLSIQYSKTAVQS